MDAVIALAALLQTARVVQMVVVVETAVDVVVNAAATVVVTAEAENVRATVRTVVADASNQ